MDRVTAFLDWCVCPSWKQGTILERHKLTATTSESLSKHANHTGRSAHMAHRVVKLIPLRSALLFCYITVQIKFSACSYVTHDDPLLLSPLERSLIDCSPWHDQRPHRLGRSTLRSPMSGSCSAPWTFSITAMTFTSSGTAYRAAIRRRSH